MTTTFSGRYTEVGHRGRSRCEERWSAPQPFDPDTRRGWSALCCLLLSLAAIGAGCGGDEARAPTEIAFGETAIVVVVNPAVNDGNDRGLPEPGATRGGVEVSADDGVSARTDSSGIAILAPLTPGARTIAFAGSGVSGEVTVDIADGELREIAVATDEAGAAIMVEVDYKTSRVFDVTPDLSETEVNDALAVSDTLVFFHGGVYEGDLDFSGSRVTLFGEGALGGEVTVVGSVTITGSDSRIRGAEITGDLTIPASGVGLSFTRVEGRVVAEGSDATLLANQLCGGVEVTGGGATLVGNAGLAPVETCP